MLANHHTWCIMNHKLLRKGSELMNNGYSLRKAAKLAEVPETTFRRWKEKGLLVADIQDSKGTFSLFSESQIEKAKEIIKNRNINKASANALNDSKKPSSDDTAENNIKIIVDKSSTIGDKFDNVVHFHHADTLNTLPVEDSQKEMVVLMTITNAVANAENIVDDVTVLTLDERANRIRQLQANVQRGIIQIGFELIAAKEQVEHGNWAEWLQKEFEWSQRTANRFMAVAERFGNSELKNINEFKASTLQAMLALPVGDEEKFIEEQAQTGHPVEAQSARDVQKSVKEWNKRKTSKTPVVEMSSTTEEAETHEISEQNNDNDIESQSIETNTQEETPDIPETPSFTTDNIEEEQMDNVVGFQTPQIQAIWSLIEETPDLHELKLLHVELSAVMYHLQEKMETLHNADT